MKMYTKIIENLDLKQIADSGQCFRWQEISENTYAVIAFERYLKITQHGNRFAFHCMEEEFEAVWKEYLDLDTDYGALKKLTMDSDDAFLKQAVSYGTGIRILRQDLWEMIVSFIISQNNNIPRIRKNIEALCAKFGKPICEEGLLRGYSFPSAEVLAAQTPMDFKELGLGYRDKYILNAAEWYVREKDGEVLRLRTCHHAEEQKEILKNGICGVGEKVANCIVLFGLHGLETCPIDTWMKKLIEEDYGSVRPEWMESRYAGVYQQYAFYYKRDRRSA